MRNTSNRSLIDLSCSSSVSLLTSAASCSWKLASSSASSSTVRFGRRARCSSRFGQRGEFGGRRAGRRQRFDRVEFEREAHVVEFLELLHLDLPDGVAAIVHAAHEAVGGEHAQRLAHRAAADAKLAAQQIRSPMLGRITPGQDAPLERGDDRGAERRGIWRRRGGHVVSSRVRLGFIIAYNTMNQESNRTRRRPPRLPKQRSSGAKSLGAGGVPARAGPLTAKGRAGTRTSGACLTLGPRQKSPGIGPKWAVAGLCLVLSWPRLGSVMTEARKLAAIMAVDVVGYSRLMGEDETGTARAVREHRDAARPIVGRAWGAHRQDDGRRAPGGVPPSSRPSKARSRSRSSCGSVMPTRREQAHPLSHWRQSRRRADRGGGYSRRRRQYRRPARRDLRARWHIGFRARPSITSRRGSRCELRRSRRKATEKYRSAGAGLFRRHQRPHPSGAPRRRQSPRRQTSVRCRPGCSPVSAFSTIAIAMGAWYLFVANRPASVAANMPAPIASNMAAHAEAAHLSIVVLPFKSLGRPRPRLFRRRHNGQSHHRPLAHQGQLRDREHDGPHLQGQNARRQGDRRGTWRSLCARGVSAARSEPRSRQRATDRCGNRRSFLGRTLRGRRWGPV